MLTQKNILSLLKQYNIKIKKQLGQNFLVSKNSIEKILKSFNIEKNDTVLEIGAGLGNLTEYLVEKTDKVIAVEKDKKLAEILKIRLSSYGNLKVICEDILKFNFKNFKKNKKIKVIGNLPYYISSDIIKYLIHNKENISFIYCSLQKEFVDRLLAKPGSRDYGRLTLFIKYFADVEKVFDIDKSNFFPVPKVDSSFICIKIREKPFVKVEDESVFFSLIEKSFSERRKKLINNLEKWHKLVLSKNELKEFLKQFNIKENVRAEELSIYEFSILSNQLKSYYVN